MEGWCWRGPRLVFAMKRGLVDGILLCLLESERKLNRREMRKEYMECCKNTRKKREKENSKALED